MISILQNYIKNILDKPWLIFIIIALLFGNIMIFITPPDGVPDEKCHLYRACEVAQGIFYNKTPAPLTKYDKYFNNFISEKNPNGFHLASRNSPFMYITSALGIKIGSLFTQNGIVLFLLSRFLNLIAYIILVAFAIKITPVFKWPFMFTALFPMALYQGMSLSADSFNNGFAFLYFAYVFKLIFQNCEISKKEYKVLFIVAIIGALLKSLIFPLFLLIFLPKFSKEFKHNKYIYIILLMFFTILTCFIWLAINYKNINTEYDVIQNPLYIFIEPGIVVAKLIFSTYFGWPLYLRALIGHFGYLEFTMKAPIYFQTAFIFLSMFIFFKENVKAIVKSAAIFSFILFYCLIQYSHLIYWSNPSTYYISGFQGRYLIPLMPLLFLVLACKKFNFKEKYITAYKILIIVFLFYLLSVSCYTINAYYHMAGI